VKANKIFRYLKFMFLNPDYFYNWFYGKPEKVISALTGETENLFFKLKEQLNNDSIFIKELRNRTLKFANRDFNLDLDHHFLYSLVRTIKPTVILETGVLHGYFTACFLKGIHDNYKDSAIDGKVISIDLPAYEIIHESTHAADIPNLPPGCQPGWVIPDYLRDRWQLNIGDSRELLPEILDREKNISLFFHDSLHTYSHMTFEFESVYPVLNKGAYLMSHDIHWNRSFKHFVRNHNQKEFSVHGFGIFRKGFNNLTL